MKANELMVGDYVYNHRNWECPIVEIHKNSAVVIARHYGEEEFFLSDLRPIPLTEEILKKNGFDTSDPEVKQYHFTEDGQSYHFSLRQMYNQKDNKPNGYSFYAFSVLTIIDYVHQLQHALRLCGIDKEIEL